jgi:hypothetical protein
MEEDTMAVSQGSEHVQAALGLIQSVTDGLNGLDGVSESWRAETVGRLGSTADLLRATTERFFLKTRMCLPFARRCEEAAKSLDTLLAELSAESAPDAEQRLTVALGTLEKAARTLDERSLMQGMAIT